MEWLRENWFSVFILILFIAMHFFGLGCGGHGGHKGPGGEDRKHKGHGEGCLRGCMG